MKDGGDRPVENSLDAYQTAWSAGLRYCECDIAVTADGHLVLSHDSNFSRLALFRNDSKANIEVGRLTLRDLMSLTLKSGSHPPVLMDLLVLAKRISRRAQMVVEIKPGNTEAAGALVRLLSDNPQILTSIAVVMSFDLLVIHKFAEFYAESDLAQTREEGRPNFLFLTETPRAGAAIKPYQQFSLIGTPPVSMLQGEQSELSVRGEGVKTSGGNLEAHFQSVRNQVDAWICRNSKLDGIYLQYENCLRSPTPGRADPCTGACDAEEGGDDAVLGSKTLQMLAQHCVVGVWGSARKNDPDTLKQFQHLVRLGASYVNSDLPLSFAS